MYRLLWIEGQNEHVIYDPRLQEYMITDPSVHLGVDEPGNMSFSLFSDHTNLSRLVKMKHYVELREDGEVIYRGRITKNTVDFNKTEVFETEGLLACLNDSIIEPHSFPADFEDIPEYQAAASTGNVVAYYLGWVLSQHNAQVETEQQIKLGTVTVTDPNNFITRSTTDFANAWSFILDKFVNSSLGGHLLPRYESDGVYLDYVADYTLTNAQTVEFAGNLLDLVNEKDATQIFTVIYPVGAEGLTIEDLTDGEITSDLIKSGKIIYSEAGVAAYGRITRYNKWDDVTEATNLRSKAAAMLSAAGQSHTITVTACDLHCLDGTIASFRVGRYTHLTSAPHNFSADYPLTALDIDIFDPGATQITLGDTVITSSAYDQQRLNELNNRDAEQQLELEKNKAAMETIRQATTEQITAAIQNSQAIIFSALENYVETGDFDEYQRTVSAQFELTASEMIMRFDEAVRQTQEVNGDLQTKYNERMKYIRFVDGDIILGEEGNEITLTIENDRLTFKQNGQDVAYFQNNKLYVTDAEFSVSAKIGNFAFVPGPNGNLSFKKVSED